MKLILIDDHGNYYELENARARKTVLNNSIQDRFYMENDKYLLYRHKGKYRPYCRTCSKIRAQRDARRT